MPGMQIKVLDKAVRVIELLATSNKGVRLKDVVRSLALNKTTALRILRVLESHNIAIRNGDATFALGNRVLWWESCYRRNFELLAVVRPHLKNIRDLTSETALFSVLVGDRVVTVNQVISPHVTSSRYDLGATAPLHGGASGKAILAYLDSDRQKSFLSQRHLDALTKQTITDKNRLKKQLSEIRARGFAISRGERIPNTASVAATVFGPRREVVGAMAVVGPCDRLTHARLREIAPVLLNEAQLLTKRLSRGGRARNEEAKN